MANYRDDGAAARERARVLEEELEASKRALSEREAELDAQDDEVAELKRRVGELEKARPAERKQPASASRVDARDASAGRGKKVVWLVAAVVLVGGGAGLSSLFAGPGPGRARVYVGNRDIEKAMFTVKGPDGNTQRCTAKVCDFKLSPGSYEVRAEFEDYRGSTTIQVKSGNSLAKPVMLTQTR